MLPRRMRDRLIAAAAVLVALITLGALGILMAAAIAGALAAAGW